MSIGLISTFAGSVSPPPSRDLAPVWYPPQFPLQGRLPSRPEQVWDNVYRRTEAERDYHDSTSKAAGRRGMPPCCKVLHVTLCFDGTGNNLNHDLYMAKTKKPTNIGRIFRASIGTGYTGGTSFTPGAERLTDVPGTGEGQYFKYYMPGVGTPFPEVGDLDYSTPGLAMAAFGQERINWGLLMIIDALRLSLGLPRLDNAQLYAAVQSMGTTVEMRGNANRAIEIQKQLQVIAKPLRIALEPPRPGKQKLLGIKLYVYGFSRGAASARAFVNWLGGLLSFADSMPSLHLNDLSLPVSIEYLGLLDTVASVGIANASQITTGHMSWADGTQQLPDNGLVKRCLQIVASHEQRLCFPLDSIRRENGKYPANSVEVLHPGMHSNQGGGYPPGEQGKGYSLDPEIGDGLLLSQIALNDLYADAFAHGAPLKVPRSTLPFELNRESWRAMEDDVAQHFEASPTLINRFNAWRQVTLNLATAPELSIEQVELYRPLQSDQTIEQALRTQMAWITAWRIDRYAFLSLQEQDFFKWANDDHAQEKPRQAAEADRDARQALVETQRRVQLVRARTGSAPAVPLPPGVQDFDPDMARTQLHEAAQEFGVEYRHGLQRNVAIWVVEQLMDVKVKGAVQLEYKRLKADGQALVSRLFPAPSAQRNHMSETLRGNVDESRNASEPEGLLRALFDDQVHDSRAWFLYWFCLNYLKKGQREITGSYFRDRMVFFGEVHSRMLVVYDQHGQPLAATDSSLRTGEPGVAPMDAEQLAQAQKNTEALFKSGEVSDATV